MTAYECNDCHHQWTAPSVNTRAVQSDSLPACPCCGSGNTIEKVSV